MHSMVAKISHLDGQVEAVNAMGQHRPLSAGDWLREGERIVAQDGAQVSLETATGERLQVQGLQTMTLSAQLTADYLPHASDDAIDAQLLQHVLSSLQAGDTELDISTLLQSPLEFAAFAAPADHPPQADALHIADLIPEQAAAEHGPSSLAPNDSVALMVATALPSEIALQQQLLKDLDQH
ncbi:hypothetical protein ACFQ1T_08985 [Methylophilus glucosoxydans]|uniref:Retention module-containing protein n=1 Tax=Methylophilus glucosoxydans TaxID=752553 RepID=A0ABW3GH33_9PROT